MEDFLERVNKAFIEVIEEKYDTNIKYELESIENEKKCDHQ